MRTLLALLAVLLPMSRLSAQSSSLLTPVDVLDPSLNAQVVASTTLGPCQLGGTDSQSMSCFFGDPSSVPVSSVADGSLLVRGPSVEMDWCPSSGANSGDRITRFVIVHPDRTTSEVLRLHTNVCLQCHSPSTCSIEQITTVSNSFDTTNGTLHLYEEFLVWDYTNGQISQREQGRVAISSFPTLFDTLPYLPAGRHSCSPDAGDARWFPLR
jgi:hypothetical protein